MIKKITLVLILSITLVVTNGQVFPDFGILKPEEIQLKECAFDKEAEAVILLDHAVSNYDNDYSLITERRIRLKILRESGKERADISILYYHKNDFEFVGDIEAVVVNIDEGQNQTHHKLDRKSIYRKKLNQLYSEVTFAMPHVQVGSIIEYKYKSVMKSYSGLRDWYFQSDLPVMRSLYNLHILPNYEFSYKVYKSDFLNVNINQDPQSGQVTFEMRNIPALTKEAFMDARKDYLQRVTFQLSGENIIKDNGFQLTRVEKRTYTTTWNELANELLIHSSFGSQISKNLSNTANLKLEVSAAATATEKIKLIFDHVRNSMQWNQFNGIFAYDGVKNAWEKKSGSSADINLILLNLLKEAGLESFPLLVSERDHGKVDTTYPYYDQFNKVVAYVVADDKTFILDAADRASIPEMIPFEILNTHGFIVDRKKGGLLFISPNKHRSRNLINIVSSFDVNGLLHGRASIYNYDYAKLQKVQQYRNNKKQYEESILKPYSVMKIDSFIVKGDDKDSEPLINEIKFDYPVNKSGNYHLFNYNLFTGFENNPFVSDRRFSNINFGCPYSYTIIESIQLAEGLATESLPKNIKVVTPDKGMMMSRSIEQNGNTIGIRLQIDINRTLFPSEEYAAVKDFYKKMIELLNEPIIIKGP